MSTLPQSTTLPSSTSQSTALTMLVHRITNPVNPSIITNLLMRRIHKDNLVVLHGGILVDPVRVQYAKVGEFTSDLFFGYGLEVTFKLEVVDTLVLGFTPDHTTVVLTLTSSASYTAADDDVALLGFVAEAVGLVGTGGVVAAGDFVGLAVFPCADAEEETEGVGLLMTP